MMSSKIKKVGKVFHEVYANCAPKFFKLLTLYSYYLQTTGVGYNIIQFNVRFMKYCGKKTSEAASVQ